MFSITLLCSPTLPLPLPVPVYSWVISFLTAIMTIGTFLPLDNYSNYHKCKVKFWGSHRGVTWEVLRPQSK